MNVSQGFILISEHSRKGYGVSVARAGMTSDGV